MIADALLGLGLVAIIEGLALALAPAQMREALERSPGWTRSGAVSSAFWP